MGEDKVVPTAREHHLPRAGQAARQQAKARRCSNVCVAAPDLDVALARFEELSRPAPRLENAATRVGDRFLARFAARDWDAMAEMLVADHSSDDRRRVVNAGIRRGRDAEIQNWRAMVDIGFTCVTSAVVATRGERLVLSHLRGSQRDQRPETFSAEVLGVIEINAEKQIVKSYGTLNTPGFNRYNASVMNAPYSAYVIGDYTGITPPFGFDNGDN